MSTSEFTSRGISPADRKLIRRLTIGLLYVVAFAALFTRLQLLYSHKFFDATGRAQWIWDRHDLSRRKPIAFFAARDFDLPEDRYYTKLKIEGDPEYTFWLNGKEIGGKNIGESPSLDEYDVSSLVHTGKNRIVVALRSTDGVGGLLASIDLSPERVGYVVSGADWKIFRRWSPELLRHNPPSIPSVSPMLLGEPPLRRWNYLSSAPGVLAAKTNAVVQPKASFSFPTAIPAVRIVEGVAVTYLRHTTATVFDFAPAVSGRLRLVAKSPSLLSLVVNVRFANTREELTSWEGNITPFVFAPGEVVAVDPQERQFRYALVYEGLADAAVLR